MRFGGFYPNFCPFHTILLVHSGGPVESFGSLWQANFDIFLTRIPNTIQETQPNLVDAIFLLNTFISLFDAIYEASRKTNFRNISIYEFFHFGLIWSYFDPTKSLKILGTRS